MTVDEIEQKVKATIADELSLDIKQIRKDMHLIDDLGIDSLGYYNLIMQLEDQFNINISDKDFEGVQTVRDSIKRIERLAA
jgi:acyl carrier protein